MKVIDPKGKEREAVSLKLVSHSMPDTQHPGQHMNVPLVEVVIRGKTLQWKDWYRLDEFKKLNPNVVI